MKYMSEKVFKELLKYAMEMEIKSEKLYRPFNEITDMNMRRILILLARKYSDMTENFAQSLARKAERYGVAMSVATLHEPKEDGVILVIRFGIQGIRDDIFKAYMYMLQKWVVRHYKYYPRKKKSELGVVIGSGTESGTESPDTGSHTSPDSEENKAEGYSEGDYGSRPDSAGDSESAGGVIIL